MIRVIIHGLEKILAQGGQEMKQWGQSFTVFHVQSISPCQKFVLHYYMQICSLH